MGRLILNGKDLYGQAVDSTTLTATLAVGSTTVTFTDASITNDSFIDIYTDTDGVYPISKSQSGTTVTLTFKPQSTVVGVGIRVLR